MNIIKSIAKKDLLHFLRDKKTVLVMIVLPLILYPVLILGSIQVGLMIASTQSEQTLSIAIDQNLPEELVSQLVEDASFTITPTDDPFELLELKEVDAYMNYSSADSFTIYYNSSIEDSSLARRRVDLVLDEYKNELVEEILIANNLSPQVVLSPITYDSIDIANTEEKVGFFLSSLLPLFLIIGIVTASVTPAIDVVAAEKESGTIETLLTLPISNFEIITGKYIAVITVSILAAVLNILSLFGSIGLIYILQPIELEMFSINFSQFIFPLMVTALCVFLYTLVITAISICVCSQAKSFKEAQNYATPLMLVFMFSSYVVFIPNFNLTPLIAAMPLINVPLLIKEVLLFQYDLTLLGIVLISNIAFCILSILALGATFDSEKILFGEGRNFTLLNMRSNIKKGMMPSPGDALMLYAIGLLAFFYIALILQAKLGFTGIALTQLLILLLPIFYGVYIKTDFKKCFAFRRPSFRAIVGSLFFLLGLFLLNLIVVDVLLRVFPSAVELMEEMGDALSMPNVWLNLLVVAVLPAICEEVFFRGFLYKGLENNNSPKRAILISSILFGLFHIDFIRIIPTSFLGIGFAYALYKTGSIFVPMMMHFINNSIAVFSMHLSVEAMTTSSPNILTRIMMFLDSPMDSLPKFFIYLGLGLALLGIGNLNMKKSHST